MCPVLIGTWGQATDETLRSGSARVQGPRLGRASWTAGYLPLSLLTSRKVEGSGRKGHAGPLGLSWADVLPPNMMRLSGRLRVLLAPDCPGLCQGARAEPRDSEISGPGGCLDGHSIVGTG